MFALSFFLVGIGVEMTQKTVLLTPEGLQKLKAELDDLLNVRRPQVADRIQKAKELASTVNNAEYDDAKNEQAFVEGRILTIENLLKNATIVSEGHPRGRVEIGSRVTLLNPEGEKEQYTIVGSAEADPLEGKISNESPVGRAVLGKRVGEKVDVVVPAGAMKLKIVKIE